MYSTATSRSAARAQLRVAQRRHLHAAAAIAFHAMAGAADQQPGCVRRAVAGHVHRQRLAVQSGERMRLGLDRQAGGVGGGKELLRASA